MASALVVFQPLPTPDGRGLWNFNTSALVVSTSIYPMGPGLLDFNASGIGRFNLYLLWMGRGYWILMPPALYIYIVVCSDETVII